MNDLISRQAAIEYIKEQVETGRIFTGITVAEAMIEVISEVPSAQPEIIRCKDCKHYTPVTAQCEIRGKGLYIIRGMDDFCSRAERRNDACRD